MPIYKHICGIISEYRNFWIKWNMFYIFTHIAKPLSIETGIIYSLLTVIGEYLFPHTIASMRVKIWCTSIILISIAFSHKSFLISFSFFSRWIHTYTSLILYFFPSFNCCMFPKHRWSVQNFSPPQQNRNLKNTQKLLSGRHWWPPDHPHFIISEFSIFLWYCPCLPILFLGLPRDFWIVHVCFSWEFSLCLSFCWGRATGASCQRRLGLPYNLLKPGYFF